MFKANKIHRDYFHSENPFFTLYIYVVLCYTDKTDSVIFYEYISERKLTMIHEIKMLDGEYFWGGSALDAPNGPFNKDSGFKADYTRFCGIQTMPMYVSNKGRFIWSEEPFKVEFKNGTIYIDGGDTIEVEAVGTTLKEAYMAAMERHFPFDGKELPERFFEAAQYNTWMEFTYSPTQDGVMKYAKSIIANGFEPGILIIDEGWHKRYGEWEFDTAKFPNPKKMVDDLHSMGFIVMLWVVPTVTADSLSFQKHAEPILKMFDGADEIFTRDGEGKVLLTHWWNGYSAVLDMRKELDREFLDRQLQRLMNDYGIDGFKFDGGSVNMYHPNNAVNKTLRNDHDPHAMNNAWNEFGRRYTYHEYKDSYRSGGKNCIQRLQDRNHSWTNEGINTIIPCAITQGLIGTPFICPDMIGGGEWTYAADPTLAIDEELFVRMAQLSSLFPMMQFSWAPWRALSEENLKIVAQSARLHKEMAPEIIKLVKESQTSGEPILRNLEYNYPNSGYEAITDEFMLGTDILVCPVITKNTTKRDVVFPDGTWTDTDGNEYQGNTVICLDAPINKLLWFKRK